MGQTVPRVSEPLRSMIGEIEESGWAAEVCDADWRLVWMASEARALLGNPSDEELGIGRHIVESRLRPIWDHAVTQESRQLWVQLNVPQILADTPAEDLVAIRPESADFVRGIEPAYMPAWTQTIDFVRDDRTVLPTRCFATRLRTPAGESLGTVYLYGPPLPATLASLVTQGDQEMFRRMARLAEPGRRETAVMFADLQASGLLSRRLPSAAYFELIRELTTQMDAVVIDQGGIVGTHAGDGITAFFIAEQFDSPSRAALACLGAARAMSAVARETAAAIDQVEPGDVLVNVGAHWGATLYLGQVVTGGRLEVTALGDEVNECARIQQVARDGAALASKPLIERLSLGDAASLGIDPVRMTYTAIAELPGASEKAIRDAGAIAVASLPS